MAVRNLQFVLSGKDNGASAAFDGAAKSAGKLNMAGVAVGSALGGLASGGIGSAIGALKSFASGGVDAFAAVEDATSAAGVQFGSALPQVVAFAEGAAKSFGISKRAALDAANEFGTFGKAAGLQEKDLATFSTDLTALAGDLASFKGTSTEQAIGAIGSALRGENEPMRAYGVLLDDASMRQEALAQGLIKTTKQALTPQMKVLAAQGLIFKKTKDAQGDYAATASSTANVQKTLAAATEDAQAKFGAKMAPAMTKVRQLALTLIPTLTVVVEKLTGVAAFVQRNTAVIGPLVAVVGTMAATFYAVNKAMAAGAAVKAAYIALTGGQAAATAAATGAQVGLNTAMVANPIGLVVVAIAGLVAGLVIAYKKSETFRTIVNTAFEGVKTVAQAVVRTVVGAFLGFFGTLIDGAAKAFGWVPGIGDKLKTAADEFGKFRDRANAALSGIQDKEITLRINKVGTGAQELDRITDEKAARRNGVTPTPAGGVSGGRRNVGASLTANLILDGKVAASATTRANQQRQARGYMPAMP